MHSVYKKETKNMNKKTNYKKVDQEQQARIDKTRDIFASIYDLIEKHCKTGKETNISLTRLEESQFWAIKEISRKKK